MNQKEREKYEGLSNGGIKGKPLLNPMYISATNPHNFFSNKNKNGKIILNPLGNNGNKLEVSFKATVEINNNRMPPIIGNKKLKLSQIPEREYDD